MQILDLPTNSTACRACEFHLTDSGQKRETILSSNRKYIQELAQRLQRMEEGIH